MNGHCRWLALFALGACSAGGAKHALNAPKIDTLPGGIVRVTNSGPTGWADTSGWKLVLERSIAPGENSPGQINRSNGIVADSRGRIFILDSKPTVIKIYAPDGTFVGTIGREGSGPGEFKSWGMLTISRDTLFEHDPNQSRTQSFTADGAFIHGWTSLCCWQMAVSADDSGRTTVPGMIRPDSTAKSFLAGAGYIRYHADGRAVDTIILPPQSPVKSWQLNDKDNQMTMSVPMTPGRQGTFNRAGHYVWGNQAGYTIVVSRTGLDTLRLFSATAGTVPIPDSIRQDAFDVVIKNNPALKSVAKLGDVPTNYPLWTAITVDGNGNHWVLRPGPKSEGDILDVFTPDGVLLGAVPAPFNGLYRTYWTRDRVYALQEDEATGAQAIKVYRIERGGGK
jgi:hypothetical protein